MNVCLSMRTRQPDYQPELRAAAKNSSLLLNLIVIMEVHVKLA